MSFLYKCKILVQKKVKMKNRNLVVLLIAFMTINTLYSQKSQSKIYLLGRKSGDLVKIRWSPIDYNIWNEGNKNGYILERYTSHKNGQLLPKPILDFKKEIKPLPLEQWKKIVERKQRTAILAQAIYGKTFEQDLGKGSEMARMVQKANEQDQRFTSSLLVLEGDFEASIYAGLGYADSFIDSTKNYIYKVSLSKSPSISATFFINLLESNNLPKPTSLQSLFKDKAVLLSWDFKQWLSYYSLYNIERSENGKEYTKINSMPYTQPAMNGEIGSAIFYTDSIPFNYKKYFYRVQGITMFDDLSPYSDSIEGFGYKDLGFHANLFNVEPIENSNVKLEWNFPKEADSLIVGFYIMKGKDSRKLLDTASDMLSKSERSFVLKNIKGNCYVSVYAVAKYGVGTVSMPALVQLEDSTPPSPPVGIKGTIDSNGKVLINWTPNKESDLDGYRVFASNNPKDLYLEITSKSIKDTFFTDSVDLKNLTAKKYYKIMALDKRYNRSRLSDSLELKKPDMIPPTAAQIGSLENSEKGVKFEIIKSGSIDAEKIIVFYFKKEEIKTAIFTTIKNRDTILFDSLISKNESRVYFLQTIDSVGNRSEMSQKVYGKRIDDGIRDKIQTFKLNSNIEDKSIELYWNYPFEGVKQFNIYRAQGSHKVTLYEMLKIDNVKMFYDRKIQIGTKYKYAIQAIFKDGSMSEISEIKEISYE